MSRPNGVEYPVDQRLLQKKTKDALDRLDDLEKTLPLLQKKTKDALDRLDDLEKTLPQIVSGFQQAANQLQQGLNSLTEIMDAVIEHIGGDKITKTMSENRVKKAEAMAENDRKALDQALLDGNVAVAEAVSEKSIIVGRELLADGSVKVPGYVQAPYIRIAPEFQEKLKGQKAGVSIELPTGGKFEVTAVYDVVQKADVPPAPAQTAAPETPVN